MDHIIILLDLFVMGCTLLSSWACLKFYKLVPSKPLLLLAAAFLIGVPHRVFWTLNDLGLRPFPRDQSNVFGFVIWGLFGASSVLMYLDFKHMLERKE